MYHSQNKALQARIKYKNYHSKNLQPKANLHTYATDKSQHNKTILGGGWVFNTSYINRSCNTGGRSGVVAGYY